MRIRWIIISTAVVTLGLGKPGSAGKKGEAKLEQEKNQIIVQDGKKEYIKNDMGLGRQEYQELFGQDPKKTFSKLNKRSAIERNPKYHWPKAIVPMVMNFTGWKTRDKGDVERIIKFYEEETCITFPKKTPKDKNWVLLENCDYWDYGCWSYLGMKGGKQNLCLGKGCNTPTTVLHEMGHMLGLVHEHQRDDRDKYVRINFKNVEKGQDNQFDKSRQGSLIKTPYNLQDPMHYERTAFSKDPSRLYTVSANDPKDNKLIQRADYILFHFSTISLLNYVYKCSASCRKKPKCSKGFVNKKCKCITHDIFKKSQCKDWSKDCRRWSKEGKCRDKDEDEAAWMALFCRKTCNQCK